SFIPALSALLSYQPLPGEYLFSVTSNGLAAGSSLLQAVHNAVCEVLERDAFLTTWMNKLPASRWDPMGNPDAGVATLCEAYRRRGVDIELFRILTVPTFNVLVVLALGAEGTYTPAGV